MNHLKKCFLQILCLLLMTILLSCKLWNTSSSKSKNPAKTLFEKAQSLKKRGYYNEALMTLRKLKSRYLYSPYFKSSSLMIADIYFLQSQWEKATTHYILFSKRHRRHAEIDRVFYQIGRSVFYQLPTTADRDLTLAQKALDYFEKHARLFPKSSYKKKAQSYQKKIKHLLAKQQWMIAQFHIANKKPHSALPYLKTLSQKFNKELHQKNPKLPSKKELKQMIKNFETPKKGKK